MDHIRRGAWPTSPQRQANCETGNRDSCICPTCGETFNTVNMLQAHCRYNRFGDIAQGNPPEQCHKELSEEGEGNSNAIFMLMESVDQVRQQANNERVSQESGRTMIYQPKIHTDARSPVRVCALPALARRAKTCAADARVGDAGR